MSQGLVGLKPKARTSGLGGAHDGQVAFWVSGRGLLGSSGTLLSTISEIRFSLRSFSRWSLQVRAGRNEKLPGRQDIAFWCSPEQPGMAGSQISPQL